MKKIYVNIMFAMSVLAGVGVLSVNVQAYSVFSQEVAYFCDAGIVFRCQLRLPVGFRIGDHRAEFVDVKSFSAHSNSFLAI